MVYLIYKGVEKGLAFKIMESVRKGKGLTPDYEAAMRENNVPEWYIGSCKKIKYMFPKAHAVAYVTMAFRIAWFKVHHPMAFYCAYYTVRADEFDAEMMASGRDEAIRNMKILEAKDREKQTSDKEKNVITIMEVVLEMYARGLNFLPIDLEKSDSYRFIPTPEGILPPLNAIAGLGTNAAKSIVEAREQMPFSSKEDFAQRAKVTKTIIEIMQGRGMFNHIPDSDQVTFF
jgi:DNA polymerase-3 subunit alpha (Gram-positive type)